MNRILYSIIIVLMLATVCFAAAPFSMDPSIYFNAADQETSEAMVIRCVVWVADDLGATDRDIADEDTFQLEDAAGNIVVSKKAEAAGDGLEICFPGDGIPVSGLKAEELDGGIIYVIRDRR